MLGSSEGATSQRRKLPGPRADCDQLPHGKTKEGRGRPCVEAFLRAHKWDTQVWGRKDAGQWENWVRQWSPGSQAGFHGQCRGGGGREADI